MSLVDIHVDLPSYSRSFIVRIQPSASVLLLKNEIHRTCPGQPRPDGQRLIWHGRVLADDEHIDDLWKAEPRIVHLAVHPSAWSSPPEIPQPRPSPQVQPQPQPTPTVPFPALDTLFSSLRSTHNNESSIPSHPPLAFVVHIHQKALACLSSALQPPSALDNTPAARSAAVQALEQNGWNYPAILDQEFPPPSEGGVEYKVVVIDGQTYLELLSSDLSPTPIQQHALKVLSCTFSILSMSLPSTPSVRLPSRGSPIPPHFNQLLQQLGMNPLRAGNNNNPDPVIANPNNPALPEFRQIPIRPLLAPLLMLIFRTTLLLYFVAPTRKPVFGILILAWVLYEIWRPIRNGMQNGWGRVPQNPQPGNNPVPAQDAGQPNAPRAPEAAPVANAPVQPGPAVPATLDQQASALFESLANMNIAEEERILNQAAGTATEEPGLGHKLSTFLGLFVTTLHPAIWNRRRAALRRREGVVRTEANFRNAPPPSSDGDSEPTPEQNDAAQKREELRAQFQSRPRWIQRYTERVVAEEWVDDSD